MASSLSSPGPGSPAPPLALPTAEGHARSLHEFRGRPVLLSFVGAAEWGVCRAHVIKLIQAREEIASAGADVVLVAFHDPELLTTKMLRDLEMPFVLLLDRSRETYAQWGLGRVPLRAFFSPMVYVKILGQMVAGQKSMGSAPNPNQLGGDFVIDGAGRLAFVNRMKTIYDRAPIPTMLDAVRRATSGPDGA
jgi:peroxiredoxin